MKILFQGDSITDADRCYDDFHDLGKGYAHVAAEIIKNTYKDVDFEFVNLGINGNKTSDLVSRLEDDFVKIDPDIVSVLIGINDVWHNAVAPDFISDDVFEQNYRTVLETIRTKTHARILMLEPFLLPVEDKLHFRKDLNSKIDIVRKLAREYADVYIPTDGLLQSEIIGKDIAEFSHDGVHPKGCCCEFIGKVYAEYIMRIIDKIK